MAPTKRKRSTNRYRAKWEHRDHTHNTWEPEVHTMDKAMIDEHPHRSPKRSRVTQAASKKNDGCECAPTALAEVAHNQAVVPEQELKQINIQRWDSQQLCDNQEAVAQVNHSAGLAKRTRRLFSHRNKSQLLEQSDFYTTEDTTEPAVGQLEAEDGSSINMCSSVNVCSSVRVSIDSNKVTEQESEYDQCMQNMVLDLHVDSFSKRDPASKSTRRLFKSKRIKGFNCL